MDGLFVLVIFPCSPLNRLAALPFHCCHIVHNDPHRSQPVGKTIDGGWSCCGCITAPLFFSLDCVSLHSRGKGDTHTHTRDNNHPLDGWTPHPVTEQVRYRQEAWTF
jgi:hypothetical protein